jgi:hypothetical protein
MINNRIGRGRILKLERGIRNHLRLVATVWSKRMVLVVLLLLLLPLL